MAEAALRSGQGMDPARVDLSLSDSEAQIQLIVDSSPHAIFVKDLHGRFRLVNDAFAKLLQLPKNDIVGRTNEEVLPPDLAEAYSDKDLDCLVSASAVDLEFSLEREDGRRTWAVHKFPLRDRRGCANSIFGFVTDITERKRAEEALRLSEEKFRQLAENISEVLWMTDPQKQRILYISPAYERIWGRTCASLLASPTDWLEAVHPDDRTRVATDAFTRQTAGEYDETYRIIRPDGSVRWIHDRAYPIQGPQGTFERIVGIATDITELKRVEEQLARREEQYREVFAAVTEGLIMGEAGKTIAEANPAFCRLLGYSRDEVLRLRPQDFMAPDSLALFEQHVGEVAAGRMFNFQGYLRRKDGTLFPVEVTGTPLTYHGRAHVLGSVRDISTRRATEEALRRSETEFRITFENAPIGIALVGADGRPLRCNRVVQQLLGYSEAELQTMNFAQFTHPEDVAADVALYQELMAGKRESYQMQKRYVRKTGELVRARLTVTTVRRQGGDPQYAIAMVEDITEQKKLEEQFLRAQRMESIGMLASGIAHDLNNILAPMLMAAGLLREKLNSPRDQSIVTIIENGAQRGAAIIKELLIFSRGTEHEKGVVQVRHLIGEMVHIVQETFPRNIEVDRDVTADLWPVLADATQLHQVLMNLCVNARDAMPGGGKLLLTARNVELAEEHCQISPSAKPGRYVLVTVTDTGEGIPPGVIDRIFDPFFTTKGVGKGTGLGLPTVLGIVTNHGGFLTVTSEPGKGSEFKLYLPAAEDQQAQVSPAVSAAPFGQNELILLVDDEASVRDANQHVLEANHYRVVTAANGAEALQLFVQHRDAIRLILTDLMMPVMDGVRLVRSLRVLETTIPVVAISGLEEVGSPEELRAIGIHEILRKPYDPSDLLRAVRRALTTK